jgi:hypothetical protein
MIGAARAMSSGGGGAATSGAARAVVSSGGGATTIGAARAMSSGGGGDATSGAPRAMSSGDGAASGAARAMSAGGGEAPPVGESSADMDDIPELEKPEEDQDLTVKLVHVVETPALWWSLVLTMVPFLRHLYFCVRDRGYDAGGMNRAVRELLQDGGPDGSGPRIPCSGIMYASIMATIIRHYDLASLVEFAHSGFTALDVGFGMGAFTMLLVMMGIKVHGCERDEATYKNVSKAFVLFEKAFKSSTGEMKGRTISADNHTKALQSIQVPWRIQPPKLSCLDVQETTFTGPPMVHFIFLLLGCRNKTVLNGLHAFILMKTLPERGVIIAVELFNKAQKGFLKKIGLLDNDDANLMRQEDGSPWHVIGLVGASPKIHLVINAKEKQQTRVRQRITYWRGDFPDDFPPDYFNRSSSSEGEEEDAVEEATQDAASEEVM